MNAPIGGFRALGLGIRALRRNLGLWTFGLTSEGALAACRSALVIASVLAFAARFAHGLDTSAATDLGEAIDQGFASAMTRGFWFPIIGAWIALELVAALVRVIYLAAAVVDASAVLKDPDRAPAPVIAAAAGVFTRAVVANLWLVIIELIAGLARGVLWGSSLIIVLTAFSKHRGGGGAAFMGALGLSLGAVVTLLALLFARVYRVQAIRHLDVDALTAAWQAGASLAHRLSTYLLIAVLGVALDIAGSMMVSGLDVFVGAFGQRHVLLGQAVRLMAAALVAAWTAAVEIAMVGAVCAVDLDARGELPRPPEPPPEPIHVAEAIPAPEVLIAQVIEPSPQ